MEERNSRVENDSAFHAGFDADLDFIIVDQIGADTLKYEGDLLSKYVERRREPRRLDST